MAQKKGQTGNPNGRPKGTPNKATTELRTTINAIVEGAVPDLVGALADIRETQPAKYAELIMRLMEYSMPKLRSTDTTIELGTETLKNIEISIKK